MSLTLFVVDAFTNEPFKGNPAAVCFSKHPLPERWLKSLAMEMNLSETAFVHPLDHGYSLRWFTPAVEVELCGHATLAAAKVMWDMGITPGDQPIRFHTRSGPLTCVLRAGQWIELDFPAIPIETPLEDYTFIEQAFNATVIYAAASRMDLLVELSNAQSVTQLRPNLGRLAELSYRGVVATAAGEDPQTDFVSRFFAPAVGVDEDPVTGSAHCTLGPYWHRKTGRRNLVARQVSRRGGVVRVQVRGDRVVLGGQAVIVSRVAWIAPLDN
jgi:PhzF family phenazine biosynthesis protein